MTQAISVQVDQDGRMELPRSVREALGVSQGGAVALSIEGDAVKLTSIRHNIAQAQALYRQHATNDLSVEDFIAERRSKADPLTHAPGPP